MKRVDKGVFLSAEEYATLTGGKARNGQKQPFYTSKKALWLSWTVTILLTIVTIFGSFLSDHDMTAVATITGLAWGVTGTCTAVYSSKAKAENRIKLTEGMIKNLADKYGIEAVVSLAEITLRD